MNKRYIIGLGIIVICSVVAIIAFRGSLTPYVSFAEAKVLDRSCQILGTIEKHRVRYDSQAGVLHFSIVDDQGAAMPVAYQGVIPGNFDQATSVVCRGQYVDDYFAAEQLLVKCPSKYQGADAADTGASHPTEIPIGGT
jgi:cytochrome c-type biogenesis protein CcmE